MANARSRPTSNVIYCTYVLADFRQKRFC